GALTRLFVLLARVILYSYFTLSRKSPASSGTATEMQMLSQRLARGTSLAVQGNAQAVESVKDSRDRFRTDRDALTKGGTIKGVSIDVAGAEPLQTQLGEITGRWERVEKNATALIDNQP